MTINKTHLWCLVGFALILRLLSLTMYPLMDTTEARYGEMARLMVETGDWLTPQFDYGVPFWGKPPLFAWMSAYGIEFFGLSEFAVRAPHWFAGLLTIGLAAFMTYRAGFSPLITSLVLATCGIFAIASGAVMTDMALTFSLTIAMLGFYYCWLGTSRYSLLWGYASFLGLACGLLAKGPVALVIMGVAVFPWLVIQHGFFAAFAVLWRRFPLISGGALMLALSCPWYILAEIATPGFIDYFLVGEHFKRFVVSGWQGDLYGSAHDEVRGTIWLFWLQSAAPWSFVLPVLAWKRRQIFREINTKHKGLSSFLFCWLMAPMVLFTMAGNILPAYVLPGIPALGVLVALLVNQRDFRWLGVTASIVPILLVIALLVLNLGKADSRSDRVIFEKIASDDPVFYINKRPFSGQFYSRGQAQKLEQTEELEALAKFYLIGQEQVVAPLIAKQSLTCSKQFTANSRRSLYYCAAD